MSLSSLKGKHGAQGSREGAIKDSGAVVLAFRDHHVSIVLQGRLVNRLNEQ
jgi:hypothetical protein